MSQRFEAFRKLKEVRTYAQAWMEAAEDHL
jgi:hypothetical protein